MIMGTSENLFTPLGRIRVVIVVIGIQNKQCDLQVQVRILDKRLNFITLIQPADHTLRTMIIKNYIFSCGSREKRNKILTSRARRWESYE